MEKKYFGMRVTLLPSQPCRKILELIYLKKAWHRSANVCVLFVWSAFLRPIPCRHAGLFMGKTAVDDVWPRIVRWIREPMSIGADNVQMHAMRKITKNRE